MTILPTGECFDDAIDIVQQMIRENPEIVHAENLFVVHAVCQSKSGVLWAHAWVEDRINDVDCVLWCGIMNGEKACLCTDLRDHYEFHRPTIVIKYTPMDVWRENAKTRHFGPWDPEIQKHCAKPGDKGKPIDVMQCAPMGEKSL